MRRGLSQIWHKTCLKSSPALDGMERLLSGAVVRTISGGIPGVFQLNEEGIHMPAFTFEKISPPVRRGPIPPIVKKQRGLIVQILDSFVAARARRACARRRA